ncbi:unnamed protein product, partial [Adineta steineri]
LDMLSDEENEQVHIHTDDEDDNQHNMESYERLPRSAINSIIETGFAGGCGAVDEVGDVFVSSSSDSS